MPFDAEKKLYPDIDHLLGKEKLFCASCGHWITSSDWKISIKEAYDHTVFNPAGIVFNIGCFKEAPGCCTKGNPSSEFSWFPGYKWQPSFCAGCERHLGWLFSGAGSIPVFYAIILKRITNNPTNLID